MIILGIETSCDETAAAVAQKTRNRIKILSNIVASSADLQAKYGGVIPEQAAREQIKAIIPVIEEALHSLSSAIHPPAIDAISVTYGPGLIGSLLVGVETAKALSRVWDKPLIPVNHLLAHFYANWITNGSGFKKYEAPRFPCIGLLVSGGHTDLVLFTDHGKYTHLGGTRDDAAGECFDKCARLLGLSYPGGPVISKLAKKGNPVAFNLPRPMIDSDDFDFSFSGLKTAVARIAEARGDSEKGVPPHRSSERSRARMPASTRGEHGGISSWQDPERLANLAASIEQAIVDVLVKKTIKAAQKYKVNQIIIAGGVAANQKLDSDLQLKIKNLKLKIDLSIPPAKLCTDNASMIAAAAFYNPKTANPISLDADPNLSLT